MLTWFASVALASPAAAHPSDFETLTVDFLVGPHGLQAIDAALVAGSAYEPYPASQVKQEVAVEVLEAIGVPADTAAIEPDLSERYHEVGFLIRFPEPELAGSTAFTVDSAALWRAAVPSGVRTLKISVCAVKEDGLVASSELMSELNVGATSEGRSSGGQERGACTVWQLAATDQPVSIVVGPQQLAETGTDPRGPVGVAVAVVLGGLALTRTHRHATQRPLIDSTGSEVGRRKRSCPSRPCA